MTDLERFIHLSEKFQELREVSGRVLEEMTGLGPAGGRLERSASMLTGALAKTAAELHRLSQGAMHPELRRAGVDLFHPAAAGAARDLARSYADKG